MYKTDLLGYSFETKREPEDTSLPILTYVIYLTVGVLLFFCVILPILGGSFSLGPWTNIFTDIDPYFFGGAGMALSIGLSVLGAGWGIFTAGSSICGTSVRTPRVTTKNLISIIFCEAVAVYGLIATVVLTTKWVSPIRNDYQTPWYLIVSGGYFFLGVGLIVGFGNLACGGSIGIIGSALVIVDGADGSNFVKILIVEILASATGIFAIIVGLVLSTKANFYVGKS